MLVGIFVAGCIVSKTGAGGTHDEHEDDDEHEDGGAQTVERHVLPVALQPVAQAVDALVTLAKPLKRR